MSTLTCCELLQELKNWQNAPTSKWTKKDKLFASEIFSKVGYDRIWKDCEKCRGWFREELEEWMKMMDAQIEKEKADGTFYTNPTTQKALGKFKRQADEASEKLESNKQKKPFWKKPSGIILISGIMIIMSGILGFLLGCRFAKRYKV